MSCRIVESLEFDRAAQWPAKASGLWFAGLLPESSRVAESVVLLSQASSAIGGRGQLFRIDRSVSFDLIWVNLGTGLPPEYCRPFSMLGAVAMVDWVSEAPDRQLWIPFNGRIEPAVPFQERAEMLAADSVNVWLPRDGLIRLEVANRCEVADFFASPPASDSLWRSAPEAELRFPIIRQLQPSVPVEVAELIAKDNDWIGRNADGLGELVDRESTGLRSKANRWLLKKIDEWRGEKGDAPAGPQEQSDRQGDGWINSIARSLAEKLADGLQSEREREIDKLLNMMDSDPDRALQYALPLSGGQSFRGYAVPNSKLAQRRPEFSLNGLRQGGPADHWTLSLEQQTRLRQSYHDQLSRAVAAGMHRRGAYIAAHLLGDIRLAAITLEQGGHFVEAAELYLMHLRQNDDAARCFALSGQWEKAVKLYRDTGSLEQAGDVLWDVGQRDEAIAAYEDAASRYRHSGRIFEAVRVLDEKLDRRDAALDLLWAQWPASSQATEACRKAIDLLFEEGRHDDVRQRIRWLSESGGAGSTVATAKVCLEIAKRSPDQSLRDEAADACRVAAVRAIATASPVEVDRRMELIGQLNETEDLLRRDASTFARRFREQRKKDPLQRPKQSTSTVGRSPWQVSMRQENSTGLTRLVYADVTPTSIRVLGVRGNRAFLNLIGNTHESLGGVNSFGIPGMDLSRYHSNQFIRPGRGEGPILLIGRQDEETPRLPAGIVDAQSAGLGHVESCVGFDGVLSAIRMDGGFSFVQGQFDGNDFVKIAPFSVKDITEFLIDHVLDDSVDEATEEEVPVDFELIALDDQVLLTCCKKIVRLTDKKPSVIGELSYPAIQIVPSQPRTRKRLVVIDKTGLRVYWVERNSLKEQWIAEGNYEQACILRNGFLVAATNNAIDAFELNSDGYIRRCSGVRKNATPIVAMDRSKQSEFLMAYEDGQIETWEVSRR